MKKTLTVNLGGTVFHIDEDAYQLLDKYLANLRIHFRKEEGSEEIMNENLYKKPLSSSQYCHTEEEAVTNIHKVFYQKRLYLIYLKAFLIRAAVSASTS